jgi:hypothetical protein
LVAKAPNSVSSFLQSHLVDLQKVSFRHSVHGYSRSLFASLLREFPTTTSRRKAPTWWLRSSPASRRTKSRKAWMV